MWVSVFLVVFIFLLIIFAIAMQIKKLFRKFNNNFNKEDLLEEIVGDIRDEYDTDEENMIVKKSDSEYIIEGRTNLEDINDKLSLSLESNDYDSLGGIIIEHLDRLPKVGDNVTIDNIKLTVLSLDKKRIAKVKLVKLS